MHYRTISALWTLLSREHKRRMWFVAFLMLLSGLVELFAVAAVPGFIMALSQASTILRSHKLHVIFEKLNIYNENQLAITAGIALIAMFILRGMIFLFVIWRQSSIIADVSQNLSSRLFEKYLKSDYILFTSKNTSQYTSVIFNEISRATSSYLLPILVILMNVAVIISLVTLVLIVDPWSALGVGAITAAVAYIFVRSSRRRVRYHGGELSTRGRLLQQAMNEGLGSFKHIRMRGQEAFILQNFNAQASYRRISMRALFFNGSLPKPIFETVAVVALVSLAFAMILQGRLLVNIVPTLALIGAIAIRMLPTLNHLTQMLGELNANESAANAVINDFRTFQDMSNQEDDDSIVMSGDITLENVSFRYPSQNVDALKNVSIEVPEGSSVAFVGPTGSGKSTLADLILGLIRPASGAVKVGGVEILSHLGSWQKQIGYIPQAIYLTDASIRRNIALGIADEDVDDEALNRAIQIAQLSDLVASSPEGVHTRVGEQGVKLSGGQKQRIGIARALYHDPHVLVLDEATAALDNSTERKLMTAIEGAKMGRTVIMIAHRLSTIRNCNRIYFLKSGEITGFGSYNEMIATHVDFAELAKVT